MSGPDIEHTEVGRLSFIEELRADSDMDLMVSIRGDNVTIWARHGMPARNLVGLLRAVARDFESGEIRQVVRE